MAQRFYCRVVALEQLRRGRRGLGRLWRKNAQSAPLRVPPNAPRCALRRGNGAQQGLGRLTGAHWRVAAAWERRFACGS